MRRSSSRMLFLAALLACGLATLIGTSIARAGMNTGSIDPLPKVKPRALEPSYEIKAGLDGDIFPVFASFAAFQGPQERIWATISVTVFNPSDHPLQDRIAVQVPGWSDQEIQLAVLGAGQAQKFLFAPTFLPRLYRNRELTPATVVVNISEGAHSVFAATVPVRIRPADDMYWGKAFQYAPFIASWVTPHELRVEQVLTRAKEFMPGRRLPGYETGRAIEVQERSTTQQVRAIYRALQQAGISYVKSSSTFGARGNAAWAERVRLPRESLGAVSANCIDGAVLYASLFENLGLEPEVLLVPGHAYVGVRLADTTSDWLYLDTALTGRAAFDVAVRAAQQGLARWPSNQVVRIGINRARQAGIFPMPNEVASR